MRGCLGHECIKVYFFLVSMTSKRALHFYSMKITQMKKKSLFLSFYKEFLCRTMTEICIHSPHVITFTVQIDSADHSEDHHYNSSQHQSPDLFAEGKHGSTGPGISQNGPVPVTLTQPKREQLPDNKNVTHETTGNGDGFDSYSRKTSEAVFAERRRHLSEVCKKDPYAQIGEVNGIFKHQASGVIYCFVPKAGCTFWKRVFYVVNQVKKILSVILKQTW